MEIGVMPLAHLARSKANTHTHIDRESEREREGETQRNGKLLGKVSAVVSNLGSGQSVVAT